MIYQLGIIHIVDKMFILSLPVFPVSCALIYFFSLPELGQHAAFTRLGTGSLRNVSFLKSKHFQGGKIKRNKELPRTPEASRTVSANRARMKGKRESVLTTRKAPNPSRDSTIISTRCRGPLVYPRVSGSNPVTVR